MDFLRRWRNDDQQGRDSLFHPAERFSFASFFSVKRAAALAARPSSFAPDERVRIVRGALSGAIGRITGVDPAGNLTLEIDDFPQGVLVVVDEANVEQA